MYSTLHSLLPNLASVKHPSRQTIVTEAIDFINQLESVKAGLELERQLVKTKAKAASTSTTVASDDVSVSMLNDVVVAFEVKWRGGGGGRMMRRRMVDLVEVFERRGAEVVNMSVVVVGEGDGEGEGEEVVARVGVTAVVVEGERNDVVERIGSDLLLLV